MPQGFLILEQWKPTKRGAKPRWQAIRHFTSHESLSDVIQSLTDRGKPGFYRVTQTQRMIWAEKIGGKLHLRKWHAGSPESLARSAAAFIRDKGKWPGKPPRAKKSRHR